MKALIFRDKVVDVSEHEFPVHPSMSWMDAPDNVAHGWLLVDGVLVSPPEETETPPPVMG